MRKQYSQKLIYSKQKINKNVDKKAAQNHLKQRISYQRHYLSRKDDLIKDGVEVIYNEALSGTQIFFSLLKNLPKKSYELEVAIFPTC